MRDLVDYLRASGSRSFVWGECDCCTWVCDWVLQRRGVDPAARWRGRYGSARGALRNLKPGLLPVVAKAMARAGLAATDDPQPGDVGVVQTAHGASLAIRATTGWAGKAETGIVVAPFPVLAAWTV